MDAGIWWNGRGAVVLMAADAAVARAAGCPIVLAAHLGHFHGDCEHRARQQLTPSEYDTAYRQGDTMNFDQAVTTPSTNSRTAR